MVIVVIYSLICLYVLVACIANNIDPDKTAPLGAVWSGAVVFASTVKGIKYMQQM